MQPDSEEDSSNRYHHFAKLYMLNEFHKINRFIASSQFDSFIPQALQLIYPLRKIFRSLSKLFCLNIFELRCLLLRLTQEGWQLPSFLNLHKCDQIGYLVVIHQVKDELHYRQLTLYLLLTGCQIKREMDPGFGSALPALNKLCKDFHRIYNLWINYRNFTPIQITSQESVAWEEQNYNSLVDSLLMISPPYRTKGRKPARAGFRQISPKESEAIRVFFREEKQLEYRTEKRSQCDFATKQQWQVN